MLCSASCPLGFVDIVDTWTERLRYQERDGGAETQSATRVRGVAQNPPTDAKKGQAPGQSGASRAGQRKGKKCIPPISETITLYILDVLLAAPYARGTYIVGGGACLPAAQALNHSRLRQICEPTHTSKAQVDGAYWKNTTSPATSWPGTATKFHATATRTEGEKDCSTKEGCAGRGSGDMQVS